MTVVGVCSCMFASSWEISTHGVSGVNYLSFLLWNWFNKSFTKVLLKGCPGQGTSSLQSLRDHNFSYKLIFWNFLTEFVMCYFVRQDQVIEPVAKFAFESLLFGLVPRFVHWVFIFSGRASCIFLLLVVLGWHAELGDEHLPLQPH